MDNIASGSKKLRQDLFEYVAQKRRIAAVVVEKDFWVCWALKHVFSLNEVGQNIIFKGGTSLSKVYNLIQRFSEDVDLSIRRDFLGFAGANDPEMAQSNTQRKLQVEKLREACRTFVQISLKKSLSEKFSEILGKGDWILEADPQDLNVLNFRYPRAVDAGIIGEGYLAPTVRLELGAGSDPYPIGTYEIQPYAAEELSSAFKKAACSVIVLEAERTFWEKATLLHSEYHRPAAKTISERLSRHYYDLFQLSQSPFGTRAIEDMQLLSRVATHKSVYFASSWAHYETAKPGSLRLLPHHDRLDVLLRDYQAMEQMFFRDPPKFEMILNHVRDLEERINKK